MKRRWIFQHAAYGCPVQGIEAIRLACPSVAEVQKEIPVRLWKADLVLGLERLHGLHRQGRVQLEFVRLRTERFGPTLAEFGELLPDTFNPCRLYSSGR